MMSTEKPIYWNVSTSDGISVYHRSGWNSEYHYLGTGGYYEGNGTPLGIAIYHNTSSYGWIAYNVNRTYWDVEWVIVREFIPWRFVTYLVVAAMGFLLACIIYLGYNTIVYQEDEPEE